MNSCNDCKYRTTKWFSEKAAERSVLYISAPEDLTLLKKDASPVLGSLYGICAKGNIDTMKKVYNDNLQNPECFEQTDFHKKLDAIIQKTDDLIAKFDYKNRISAELITSLEEGQIFVFGSNESGKHTKFAAKTAMRWGAKMGQAAGLQGRTYGIPTKDKKVARALPLQKIKVYVDDFVIFAKENPQLIFLVTEIGCGASKYKPKDIAPLFAGAVELPNVHLPARFWHKLKK